jgi:phage repressor protein C with HTH and peptisase S24 domain
MSGKEARYILQQNNINLSWLSELLGIKPQSLQSRLNAATFSPENQLMINKVTGRRIFDIDIDIQDIEADANRIPVLDLRTAAGFEYVTLEDTMTLQNPPVAEYVTMSGLKGCVGLYVYGDSMSPEYRAGDIVFVRKEPELDGIDYGRAYMIVTASERVLKCIYKSNHDADLIRLVSINEDVNRHGDRLFPDREMRKENIIAVYRVEGVFRRERM